MTENTIKDNNLLLPFRLNNLNSQKTLNATQSLKRSILIVEDDVGLQTVLSRVISRCEPNSEITWVTTGSEARVKLQEVSEGKIKPYELILADLLLPNLELGTRIWRFNSLHTANIPFIIMSSTETETYLRMFLSNENPPPFLRKPFKPDDVANLLSILLRGYNPDNSAC